MNVTFRCQHCNKKLKADVRHAGAKVKCSGCQQVVVVPEAVTKQVQGATVVTEDLPESPLEFRKKLAADEEMDMTPMIDMTFLLLIFFMVSATFSLQKSIPIPAPDSEAAATQTRTLEEIEQDDDFIIVRIDKDDTVWVNESEARSRHDLLDKLRDIRDEGPKAPGTLMVMANGDCRHETVVMVLDAGTAVGMQNVRLASASEDDF
jgi:biopolymer transport protein ExbD